MSVKILQKKLAALIILFLARNIEANTKQLYNLKYSEPHMSQRLEIAELHNPGEPNEELVVYGVRAIKYEIPGDSFRVYEERTDYTAGKNGYYAKYKIRQAKITDRLSALALKVAAG